MALFNIFKKKEKEEDLKIIEKELKESELSKPIENIQKPSEISLPIQTQSQQTQDKFSLIETKIENLRIYLEMINSKLDKLETLLKSKGLI